MARVGRKIFQRGDWGSDHLNHERMISKLSTQLGFRAIQLTGVKQERPNWGRHDVPHTSFERIIAMPLLDKRSKVLRHVSYSCLVAVFWY